MRQRPYLPRDPVTGERVCGPLTDCKSGGKLKDSSLCEVEVRVNPKDDIRLLAVPSAGTRRTGRGPENTG